MRKKVKVLSALLSPLQAKKYYKHLTNNESSNVPSKLDYLFWFRLNILGFFLLMLIEASKFFYRVFIKSRNNFNFEYF